MAPVLATILLLISTYHSAQAVSFMLFNGSLDNYVKSGENDVVSLINSPVYRSDWPIYWLNGGYTYRLDKAANSTELTNVMLQAAIDQADRNVFLTDWEYEANTGFNVIDPLLNKFNIAAIGINYPIVAELAKNVADKLSKAWLDMKGAGVNLKNINCVGHSAGSYICGKAGKGTKDKGTTIGMITALDPANPRFEGFSRLHTYLDPTHADFVYAVHTDWKGYGTDITSLVTMNIWANNNTYVETTVQPGCEEHTIMLTTADFCSHRRAGDIYASALRNPDLFQVTNEDGTDTTYIGDDIDKSSTGSYYFCTTATYPYGERAQGLDITEC